METLCLFDLDGTLTDPIEGIAKAFAYSLDYFGIPMPKSDNLNKYIGPPLRESFADFVKPGQVEEAVSKFREYYSETGLLENRLYDGIVDLLKRLKADDCVLAVATSKPTEYAKIVVKHFEIDEYFDLISGCELDGTRGNKCEVIKYALEKLNPNNKLTTVMIGDRKHDVHGAKEMGIATIGITWGYGSREELFEAGAAFVVDTPAEVYEVVANQYSTPS